jgi:murein DD-endopeptidase MepM/ murein hydrolase activator NlpD
VSREPSPFGFIWPLDQISITSYFTAWHPLGIDINGPYVPVAASAGGQVIFVGGDPAVSYGYYVEIDHGSGYETLYAHLSQISVQMGEWLDQGQILGVTGTTGRSTGPHLHFELKRNGVVMDPLLFMP